MWCPRPFGHNVCHNFQNFCQIKVLFSESPVSLYLLTSVVQEHNLAGSTAVEVCVPSTYTCSTIVENCSRYHLVLCGWMCSEPLSLVLLIPTFYSFLFSCAEFVLFLVFCIGINCLSTNLKIPWNFNTLFYIVFIPCY